MRGKSQSKFGGLFLAVRLICFCCLFLCEGKSRGALLYLPDSMPAAMVAGRLLVLLSVHNAYALLFRGTYGQPAFGWLANFARHAVSDGDDVGPSLGANGRRVW